ncbi:hypothetical protein [Candidatus Vidania fulgoroideorum]
MTKICLIGLGNVGYNFFKNFININKYNNLYIFSIVFNKNDINKKRKINKLLKNKCIKIFIDVTYKKYLIKSQIKVIIELTSSLYHSRKIVFNSLKNKKIIITANKNLVALEYSILKKYINNFLFIESSIFGGVPIINNIVEHYKNLKINNILTILNGTTNYILDNIFRNKMSYKYSIRKAIKYGFSEKNPLFDLLGLDTFYKSYIILKLIYNFKIYKKYINGLNNISEKTYYYLVKYNYNIKLIGNIKIINDFFSLEVFPYICDLNIKKEYNIIKILTSDGNFEIKGKGAGGNITSYSVINNIFNFKKIKILGNKKILELDIIKKKIILIINKKKRFFKKLKFFIDSFSIKLNRMKKNIYFINYLITNKRFFFLKSKLNIYCFNNIFKIL